MWRDFWPHGGKQQTWDAVAWIHRQDGYRELLLIEAKANKNELTSKCEAKSPRSLDRIQRAFTEVKRGLCLSADADWMVGYYQHANRIAAVWFLRNKVQPVLGARLLNIYFMGDKDSNGSGGPNYPTTIDEWQTEIIKRDQNLGLQSRQGMPDWIHSLFIDLAQ